MSKYNFSCTMQNTQHIVIFWTFKIFFSFRGQNKNKKCCTKHNREKPAPSTTAQSTKIIFQEKSSKIN